MMTMTMKLAHLTSFLLTSFFLFKFPVSNWRRQLYSAQVCTRTCLNVHQNWHKQLAQVPLCQEDEHTMSMRMSIHCTVQCPNGFAKEDSRRLHSLVGFFEKYPLVSPLESLPKLLTGSINLEVCRGCTLGSCCGLSTGCLSNCRHLPHRWGKIR